MITYMLDTNICIYLINGRHHENILKKLVLQPVGTVAISSLVYAELQYGIAKSSRFKESQQKLALFVSPLQIVHFDASAASEYGVVRTYLENKGEVIGAMDLLIAAHCLALQATLITNNSKEFSRVPNLQLENWL